MKEQVTSIEQSKRLIELGVPEEKACLVWCPIYRFDMEDQRFINIEEYNIYIKGDEPILHVEEIIPAFTVADLIAILPTVCGGFQIGLDRVRKERTHIFYEDYTDSSHIIFFIENSLVESCVKAIEWIISNNYKLNI